MSRSLMYSIGETLPDGCEVRVPIWAYEKFEKDLAAATRGMVADTREYLVVFRKLRAEFEATWPNFIEKEWAC